VALELLVLIAKYYRDPLDGVTGIHLSQSLFDYVDPIVYAPHAIGDPLPGRKAKRIVIQEGKDDDQVPNRCTRAVVRALGVPLMSPPVESVLGITEKPGPLPSAYVQWNTEPSVKPEDKNVPPKHPPAESSAHEAVRRTESCMTQLEKFFTPTGQIENTCGNKPCGKN